MFTEVAINDCELQREVSLGPVVENKILVMQRSM
jgi:hypothetical protein